MSLRARKRRQSAGRDESNAILKGTVVMTKSNFSSALCLPSTRGPRDARREALSSVKPRGTASGRPESLQGRVGSARGKKKKEHRNEGCEFASASLSQRHNKCSPSSPFCHRLCFYFQPPRHDTLPPRLRASAAPFRPGRVTARPFAIPRHSPSPCQ